MSLSRWNHHCYNHNLDYLKGVGFGGGEICGEVTGYLCQSMGHTAQCSKGAKEKVRLDARKASWLLVVYSEILCNEHFDHFGNLALARGRLNSHASTNFLIRQSSFSSSPSSFIRTLIIFLMMMRTMMISQTCTLRTPLVRCWGKSFWEI